MIVSASYRTDIPAFFAPWFEDRWRAGYALVPNPYNRKLHRVGLNPEETDAMVFWTRWLAPFFGCLDRVFGDGVPFVIQDTATGLGEEIEPGVPDWRRAVETMHRAAGRYGAGRVVWRFDPIVLREGEDWQDTALRFAAIAEAARGAADEAIVSFTQFYAKTRRALDALAAAGGSRIADPSADTKRRILEALAEIARRNGMTLGVCGQPDIAMGVPGVVEAACIDADRLSRVAGQEQAPSQRLPLRRIPRHRQLRHLPLRLPLLLRRVTPRLRGETRSPRALAHYSSFTLPSMSLHRRDGSGGFSISLPSISTDTEDVPFTAFQASRVSPIIVLERLYSSGVTRIG
jgi:hypothetical protein